MRVVQLVIYGFWGICLFAAAMGKFGDFFTAGTGFWSVVMLFVAGLCQLLASIASIVWAFYGTGNLRAKYLPYKFVNNYTVPVLIIVLALVANAARSSSDEARPEHINLVLKTAKSLPLLVKITLRMLLITPNLPKNNASKQQKRRLRMLYLPQKKKDRQKRKKLNVSMMLIATLRNIKLAIIFVR